MSWIKENYHIAALGVGALALVGLGYVGFSSAQEVKEGFNEINAKKGDTTTCGGGDIANELISSLATKNPLEAKKMPSGRPVHLFTSVDLFTEGGNKDKLLDLLTEGAKVVHPPIDNQWWVDNQIDPSMSDAPQSDEDGDGFTNLEEFKAETDPQDAKSHGDLITKLEVVSVESAMWRVEFNSVLGDGFQFNFLYKAPGQRRLTNRMGASDAIGKGELFFKSEPGMNRFKFIDIEGRMEDTSTGRRERRWAIIEDQRPNKLGQKFEIPFGLRAANRNRYTFFDHTVTFRLNAISEGSNEAKVEENGSFALPFSAKEKPFKLIEVKLGEDRRPASVVVEWTEGDKKESREIPMPKTP